ncbi:hypothetical protein CC2G_007296 [Coprinopsis cinerea AmutBmut pab1-1]|nr:hypothetical protein CC2G_007296 [Coprinopsis cinerea AmutBmut pab1-1]
MVNMAVSDLFVAIVRMHHITNPSKFRRLKRFALHANVSGLVKKGKPGLVVFDGSQSSVKTFLANARGLRYLEYHHVDTTSLPDKSKRVADVAKRVGDPCKFFGKCCSLESTHDPEVSDISAHRFCRGDTIAG